MYENYIKKLFESYKNSDVDYLLVFKANTDTSTYVHTVVPFEDFWETVDEAISIILSNYWYIVEIYDLYAEFETSMIRSVKKGHYQDKNNKNITKPIMLMGDHIDLNSPFPPKAI